MIALRQPRLALAAIVACPCCAGMADAAAPMVKEPFGGATELAPGVKAVASRGHTPGHTTLVVESNGQKLVNGAARHRVPDASAIRATIAPRVLGRRHACA